ncbi:MAG TPA: FAD-dependent oxidoreductase, partial [Nitrososphaerales archaeon]|nr:FAD-dependent oxidoreductase [Nitrososphaerales archaeon]
MKESASIVVIGAGIIGSSIAYSLAKRNVKDVVVLEKGKAGSGSTSAALGGFRYQFSNELSVRMSIESISAIESFQEEMGYDPLVRHDGYVFFASNENSYSKLKENCRMANSLGVPVEVLSKEELQSRFPFYSFEGMLGGTLCMKEGHASTSAVLQGYISKSKQLGVQFFENTEVTKISKDGGFRISTGSGEISSKKVIIAAGAYSGLVGELASVKIPIKPYPRKILVTNSFSDGIPWEIPLMIDVDSTLAIGREGRGM